MKKSSTNSGLASIIFSEKIISTVLILTFLATLSSFISIQRSGKDKAAHRGVVDYKNTLDDLDILGVKFMKNVTFQLGDDRFDLGNVLVVDESFFHDRGMKFIIGDPKTAFKNSHSVIVTERIANLVCSGKLAECQIIKCGSDLLQCEVKITGVIADMPEVQGVKIEYLVPAALFEELHADNL